MSEEEPGPGVQKTIDRQHEIQGGLGKSDIKYLLERKLEFLNDFHKLRENISVNMEELFQWDKGSVLVEFLWQLFQLGSIYFLGSLGFSFWVLLLGSCLMMAVSAWAKRTKRSAKCTIKDGCRRNCCCQNLLRRGSLKISQH